jgi:hypothetical protein
MGTINFLFSSVARWFKKFKSGVDSVKGTPHALHAVRKVQLCQKWLKK